LAQDNRQDAGTATSDAEATPQNLPVSTAEPTEAEPEAAETSHYEDEIYDEGEQGFVHIRTPLFAVVATVASLLILGLLAGNLYQLIHNRNETNIATVNGAPITSTDFVRAAGQQDQALQSLIDQTLIQQEAKKEKVSVPDSQVNSEIGSIKQQLGTQQQYEAALQRANLNEAQLRDQIRTKDLAQMMGAKGVTVSDDEAQTYFNQNKAQYGTQTFDQAKDVVKQQLLQQKENEAIQTWISNLRSKAKIVIHIPT
jgi:parvulin-like peptidyl-prolyl isomerase